MIDMSLFVYAFNGDIAFFCRLTKQKKAASNKIDYFAMLMVVRQSTLGIVYGKQDKLNCTQPPAFSWISGIRIQ